ncbi:Uncharacterised protein [Candidatus Venteria ishoeyi]|uniref:Uncharacterized protein n=1 Tax=Candidatus Venteria ishoeyi TaxID=1899563 RepID=A0A1H6F5C6_9GAMM|nr:Uncharacterised protein [Candidatus Venteria ishoeyi]
MIIVIITAGIFKIIGGTTNQIIGLSLRTGTVRTINAKTNTILFSITNSTCCTIIVSNNTTGIIGIALRGHPAHSTFTTTDCRWTMTIISSCSRARVASTVIKPAVIIESGTTISCCRCLRIQAQSHQQKQTQ